MISVNSDKWCLYNIKPRVTTKTAIQRDSTQKAIEQLK